MLMFAGSSILLAGNGVTSQPICPNGGTNCQVPTSALFDRAVKLSHYIHSLSSEMFNEFVSKALTYLFSVKGLRASNIC